VRCLGIPTARLAPQVRSLPVSFPARQFDEPIAPFLQPHRIAAAIVAAIAIGSCCSETHAQQVAAPHVVDNDSAKAISALIVKASHRFGLPAPWIRAVMSVESAGNLRAVSPKGAIGLMQIMPETWSDLRRRYHLGTDPYDAHDNIIAGAAYLRELHDRYGAAGFFAAYNAGPARWEDHLATGKPLKFETRAYLARLAPIAGVYAMDDAVLLALSARSWTRASLFPLPATGSANDHQTTSDLQRSHSTNSRSARDWTDIAPASNGLFVVLMSARQSQ
jgi:soluble lytic murein transglycosylase-like protein